MEAFARRRGRSSLSVRSAYLPRSDTLSSSGRCRWEFKSVSDSVYNERSQSDATAEVKHCSQNTSQIWVQHLNNLAIGQNQHSRKVVTDQGLQSWQCSIFKVRTIVPFNYSRYSSTSTAILGPKLVGTQIRRVNLIGFKCGPYTQELQFKTVLYVASPVHSKML
jgi:hypothetical protein